MNIEEYLNAVGEQIRCKAARGPVQDEIRCHIEDQKEAFLHEGMSEADAELAAVKEMGDPVETGIALDGIHRPKMAWGMIGLIVGLSLIGFVVQSSMKVHLGLDYPYYPYQTTKYAIILVGCLLMMIGVCYMDYTWIARYAKAMMCALVLVMGFGMFVFGASLNGTRTYIYIWGMGYNVKLLVVLFAPIYAAVLYQYRGQGYRALLKGVLWMLPVLFITKSIPSFCSTVMMFLIFTMILLFAVHKNWFQVAKEKVYLAATAILLLLPLAGYGLVMGFGMEYHKERLQAYIQLLLDPSSMAADMGYQTMAIRNALSGSQVIGESVGALEKYQNIPEVGDYVLVYMISYYGILIGVLVVGLMLFLLSRLLKVSLRQKNQLGMVMGFGCCAAFFVQIAFYVLSNLGIPIFAGSYCPFITYGGSGMLASYVLLGVLLSIYRYQNVVPVSGTIRRKPTMRIRLVIEKNE